MNLKQTLVAATLLGAVAAYAETPSIPHPAPFQSTLSRDVVLRELIAAQAAGRVPRGEAEPSLLRSGAPDRSRAAVAAEAIEASRAGTTSRGELSAFASQAEGRAVLP